MIAPPISPTLSVVFPDFMRGDSYNYDIPFMDSSEVSGLFDFTPWTSGGYSLSLKFMKGGWDGDSIGTVTVALVGAATLGVINVYVAKAVAAAVDSTRLYYSLISTDGTYRYTICTGSILVNKDANH